MEKILKYCKDNIYIIIPFVLLIIYFTLKLLNYFKFLKAKQPLDVYQPTIYNDSNQPLKNFNNPGNLIYVARNDWQGQQYKGGRFTAFINMGYGCRAWFKNLNTHRKRGSIYNINSLIDVLTPSGENKEQARENFKNYISQNSSISRTQSFNELTDNQFQTIALFLFNFEGNKDWVSLNILDKQKHIKWGYEN